MAVSKKVVKKPAKAIVAKKKPTAVKKAKEVKKNKPVKKAPVVKQVSNAEIGKSVKENLSDHYNDIYFIDVIVVGGTICVIYVKSTELITVTVNENSTFQPYEKRETKKFPLLYMCIIGDKKEIVKEGFFKEMKQVGCIVTTAKSIGGFTEQFRTKP